MSSNNRVCKFCENLFPFGNFRERNAFHDHESVCARTVDSDPDEDEDEDDESEQ